MCACTPCVGARARARASRVCARLPAVLSRYISVRSRKNEERSYLPACFSDFGVEAIAGRCSIFTRYRTVSPFSRTAVP